VKNRRWSALVGMGIVAMTLAVFANGLTGQMMFDDNRGIVGNSDIQHFPDVVIGSTRPLTEFSFFLNYMIHGATVVPYHLVNMCIHALAASLLYGIVRHTLHMPRFRATAGAGGGAEWLACAVALIWAVHPLQTESVTYIVQRSESLAGMFTFLALYASLRSSGAAVSRSWRAVAVGAALLAMLSKPVAVVTPLLIVAFESVFAEERGRELWRKRGRFYGALLATCLVPAVLLVLPNESSSSAGLGGTRPGAWQYLLTQCDIIVHYLRLSAWPHPLCIDYAWEPVKGLGEVWCSALALTLLAVTSFCLALRRSPAGYIGIWFFITLAPTSSILPIDDLAAERRMYLPLVAPVALFVFGSWRLCRLWPRSAVGRTIHAVLVAVVIAGFSGLTVARNALYLSEEAMWRDVLVTRPNNLRAQLGLGALALTRGDLDSAELRLRATLDRLPRDVPRGPSPVSTLYSMVQSNLGVIHEQRGELSKAIACFREAVRTSARNVDARVNLGIVLSKEADDPESERLWHEAIATEPHHPKARFCLGWTALKRGDAVAAQRHLRDVAGGHGELAERAKLLLAQME
jgi:tetratricopeptide (TPR) repeat protein